MRVNTPDGETGANLCTDVDLQTPQRTVPVDGRPGCRHRLHPIPAALAVPTASGTRKRDRSSPPCHLPCVTARERVGFGESASLATELSDDTTSHGLCFQATCLPGLSPAAACTQLAVPYSAGTNHEGLSGSPCSGLAPPIRP